MKNEQIAERIDAISSKMNNLIGRLTIFRSTAEGKEAHELALEIGHKLDDLINDIS